MRFVPLALAAKACPLTLNVLDVVGDGGSSSELKHESNAGPNRHFRLQRWKQVQLNQKRKLGRCAWKR